MTSFDVIFGRFLSKIEDAELAKMPSLYRHKMLVNWMETGISLLEVDKLKIEHDLDYDEEEEDAFAEDLSNAEVEVLALYMVVAWYEDKINSLDHTLLFMGSKDEKWTNQRDHWRFTRDMQDHYRKRARKLIRNHSSRWNKYLYEDEFLAMENEKNKVDEPIIDEPPVDDPPSGGDAP